MRDDDDWEKQMELALIWIEPEGGDHHGQEHGMTTPIPSLDGAIVSIRKERAKSPSDVNVLHLLLWHPRRNTVAMQ